MESFDTKPLLNKYAGKTIGETPFADVQDPERLKKTRVVVVNDANGQQRNKIYRCKLASKSMARAVSKSAIGHRRRYPCAGTIPTAFLFGWLEAD